MRSWRPSGDDAEDLTLGEDHQLLSFDDDLTLKGSYHGGGWTYTHNWDYSILQVGSDEQLKPDFKSATRHDVESSGELTMIHTFKGTASSKAVSGASSTSSM